MNRVAENIKRIRESSGMSAKTLGKKLGVSESYIIDVEQGKKVINENMITRISKILGKRVNDLGLESFETAVVKEEREKRQNKNRISSKQSFKDRVNSNDGTRAREKNKLIQKEAEPLTKGPVNEIWNQAFGDNMKNVPLYSVELRVPLDYKMYPIIDGKIEDQPFDKVVLVKCKDDEMVGFNIKEGSELMGIPVKEVIEDGFYLIESDKRKIRHVRNLKNGNLLISSHDTSLKTETKGAKEIKVFIKFFMVKTYL